MGGGSGVHPVPDPIVGSWLILREITEKIIETDKHSAIIIGQRRHAAIETVYKRLALTEVWRFTTPT